MTKKILPLFAALALLGSALAGASQALAETASSRAADDAKPAPAAVVPVTSNSDAKYAQLDNLVVQGVAVAASDSAQPGSYAYAVISAASNVCSPSVPCTEMVSRLYRITVSSQTKLMDVNRDPVGIDFIKAGDRINAYGLFSASAATMDALIVRDLRAAPVAKTVQLNDLVIDSITGVASVQGGPGSFAPGGPYAYVEAHADPCPREQGVYCRMPVTPYLVAVSDKTLLLSLGRKPITLGDMKVGDRFNVYGNMREDGKTYVDALVLRDLSVGPAKYVQLENLTVASVSAATGNSVTLEAYSNGSGCYDFSPARHVMPCPLGSSDNVQGDRPSYLYKIYVPSTAQVLDAARRPIKITAIKAGDVINVYGTLSNDQASVTAQIVRVLRSDGTLAPAIKGAGAFDAQTRTFSSFPLAAVGGTAPYKWTVVDGYLPNGMELTTDSPLACTGLDSVCASPVRDPNMATAWISGTPTRAGQFTATVAVYDSLGNAAKANVTINVTRRQL